MKKAIPIKWDNTICAYDNCSNHIRTVKRGRKRKYCSDSCKTMAYKLRKGLPLIPPWKEGW